jgi:YNFM family putative membrane transporter
MLPLGIAIELLGAVTTLSDSVPVIVFGIALVTFGFFASHSVASSWVGAQARGARAQSAALYLFLYYLGSSVAGSVGGFAWSVAGWGGVVAMIGLMLAVGLGLTRWLAILPSRA